MSANAETTTLKAALWYARHGLPVFPVHNVRDGQCSCGKVGCAHPGKHPRTTHGFKDATKDLAQIRTWWKEWPDASIGVPTGPASGLLAIDIDPRNGGDSSWDSLILRHGLPPATAEQLTGGGGRHIVFRDPGVVLPKELAPGIDVKGAGGYIIVAPSIHPSGQPYTWDGIEGAKALLNVAPTPAWLVAEFAAVRKPKNRTPAAAGAKWGSGERNSRLTSLAGTMRRPGMTQAAIEAALLEENVRRCEPPLPDAEVRQIAASVVRYPPAATDPERSTEAWQEPIPFGTPPPDPIPASCLPAWLGAMVDATAQSTETPIDLGALIAIAVTSSCIAGKAVVSPEPGYSEPVNLYTCPAMESGNRKTAVFTTLLEPVLEYERDRIAQAEPERKRLASERRTSEARIEKLRTKAASAADPSLLVREIQDLEANLPVVPSVFRAHADDCTPERLASLMAEQGGRIAVFSDEGGVFDLLSGRYSKGVPNLDLWLKGHAVSPVRVDRADPRRAPILLDRPHLTVGISPQPDVLESLRDKPGFRGRGLLARFLYGLPKSPLGYRKLEPRAVPREVAQQYRDGIRRLLEYAPKDAIQLRLSQAAYREWKEFQRAIEVQFRDGGMLEGLKDWGSKLPGAALRLAGVFHFVEQIGRVSIGAEISLETVARALELAACLISHARAVFALMERDPNIEHAQKLLSWIVRRGQESFSIRDCFRAHQPRFKRVDAMLPVVGLLEQHEYIRREPHESSGGRRPSDVCQVNPAILPGGVA